MPALLTNLIARAPTIDDLEAVAELVMACEIADDGTYGTKEEVLAVRHSPGFNLKTDAWVILTTGGQLTGYAQLSYDEPARIQWLAYVHPAYRGRGIGMLLLRLVESRARETIDLAPPAERVVLASMVIHTNQAARELLEQEGYTLVQHLWRVIVEMDEVPSHSSAEFYQRGKLKLDLVVEAHSRTTLGSYDGLGIAQMKRRTGIYTARQYDIYEKELRPGAQANLDECSQQPCGAV